MAKDYVEAITKGIGEIYTNKRFYIDFKNIFTWCLVLLVLNSFFCVADKLPELFVGGDVVYHILSNIFVIISNLAASVAAAIIFYYASMFIECKKNFDNITEHRKYMLFILYGHIDIVKHVESYNVLAKEEKEYEQSFKLYLNSVYAIPRLVDMYELELGNEKLLDQISNYLSSLEVKEIEMLMSSFKTNVRKLIELKSHVYVKGYTDDINSLVAILDEIEIWSSGLNKNDENFESQIEGLAEQYVTFFHHSIEMYLHTQEFIYCIEQKRLIRFLKMIY